MLCNTSIFLILILLSGISNDLNGTEDSMVNINLTKHDLIAKSMKESIQNDILKEIEEELSDLQDIQKPLEEMEENATYDI